MKFIELHDETDTFLVKANDIGLIVTARIKKRPQISSFIMLNGFGLYCKETPEEIFQKIAEATQSERAEIFQKFFEAEQRDTAPTGFMSE